MSPTHRQISPTPRQAGDYSRPRNTAKIAVYVLAVPALAMTAVAFLPGTLTGPDAPSPTLAIETPARPGEPDYRDGGLLSVAPTPNSVPTVQTQTVPEPAVVYETDPEPVPVYIPPPSPPTVVLTVPPQPPATVVREVPVPGRVEPLQDDEREDQERHRKQHDREWPEKTSTAPEPAEETATTRRGCIAGLVCWRDDGQTPKTRERDRDHGERDGADREVVR